MTGLVRGEGLVFHKRNSWCMHKKEQLPVASCQWSAGLSPRRREPALIWWTYGLGGEVVRLPFLYGYRLSDRLEGA